MQKKKLLKKTASAGLSGLLALALAVTAFVPFPRKIGEADECYRCLWEDGTVTTETFASAYADLVGTDGENVLLLRNGKSGAVKSEAQEMFRALKRGDLGEILSTPAQGTRLDSAALFRVFSDTLWFDGAYFSWTGKTVEETRARKCSSLVCLSGSVTAGMLKTTGATSLEIGADVSVKPAAFGESSVQNLTAREPYRAENGALYLETPGGVRLVAAVGGLKEIVISEDTNFADQGALIACRSLESITVPFVGNAKKSNMTAFQGQFAHLFSDGFFHVPETLKRIRVTGGTLDDYAFYACPNVEEVNACGVEKQNVARSAFVNLSSLRILHTPSSDIVLPRGAQFVSHTEPCGCTVYERIS